MLADQARGIAPRRLLFTPGPLTISERVRTAMLVDWGSRDPDFLALTARLLDELRALLAASGEQVVIPIQGSGTFAVEAMIGSIVPIDGKLLVVKNGTYADRIHRIALAQGRHCTVLTQPPLAPVAPDDVAAALANDPTITHVALVHLETGTGIGNELAHIADVVAGARRKLVVDAMSTVGAFDVAATASRCEAIAFSSNKCLQGPPGLGFVLAREAALLAGCSRSLALDLDQQWSYYRARGQWRFTPPTHVVAGTCEALAELRDEGGVAMRLARYRDNLAELHAGCVALGLKPLLPERFIDPPILAIQTPPDPAFAFDALYRHLAAQNLYIYPGDVPGAGTFRIGCIGDITAADMRRLVSTMVDYWASAHLSVPRRDAAGTTRVPS